MIPKISVIIPYYKNANTIERALISVRMQVLQPFEVLIINDASPDWKFGEEKVIHFDDLPIKVIHHAKNKNGSTARNTGIKNAKGSYLAFLDADDEWLPNHLSSYVKLLINKNKDALFYCRSIIKTDGFNDLIMPEKGIKEQNLSEYLFCNKGFIPTPSIFISKEIALINLFNEDLIRHQDYDFLFRLYRKKIKFVFSHHIGVIVHWENNDIVKKGGTADYTLGWAKENKNWFTSKAYNYFILNHVVYPLWKKRQVTNGVFIFLKNTNIFRFSFKEWYFVGSMMLFGKLIIPWRK